MKLDDAVDLTVFIASLMAISVGVARAVSVEWSAVVIGSVLVAAVLSERFTLRLIGKQHRNPADESA